MKTKITIILHTKFKDLFKEEEDKINVTKELEKQFHEFIYEKLSLIEFIYEKVSLIYEDFDYDDLKNFMEFSDCYFENFDDISDYGKINFHIFKEDLKEGGKKERAIVNTANDD